MAISINEVVLNLIKLGWFVLIFLVLWGIYLYRKNKVEEFKKTIELEKVIDHEKLNQLSDSELLSLVNQSNKSRPGSPSDPGDDKK